MVFSTLMNRAGRGGGSNKDEDRNMSEDGEKLTMLSGLEERVSSYHRATLERIAVSKRAKSGRGDEEASSTATTKTASAFKLSIEEVERILSKEKEFDTAESDRIATALAKTTADRHGAGDGGKCDLCGMASPDVAWRLDERTYAETEGREIVHVLACRFCWRDELRAE